MFQFDCVFYYVTDLERSIRFYREVLGFELKSRDVIARFDVGGALFELIPTSDSSLVSGKGNARLALKVTDLDAATRQLLDRKIAVSETQTKRGGRLATFRDPDNNEIVLWQYTTA